MITTPPSASSPADLDATSELTDDGMVAADGECEFFAEPELIWDGLAFFGFVKQGAA